MPYKDPAKREEAREKWRKAHPEKAGEYAVTSRLRNHDKIRAREAVRRAAADPEVKRIYNAAYRAAHLEEIHAKDKAKRQANPEETKAKNAANYAAHREVILVKAAAKHAAQPEVKNARSAAWRAAHLEECRARDAAWVKANPEKKRTRNQRRRALKVGAPINDFTADQWREMQARFDHRCAYCGKRAKGHLTQDHITPLSQGGSHTLSNIVPACRSCNAKKGVKGPLVQVQALLLV